MADVKLICDIRGGGTVEYEGSLREGFDKHGMSAMQVVTVDGNYSHHVFEIVVKKMRLPPVTPSPVK